MHLPITLTLLCLCLFSFSLAAPTPKPARGPATSDSHQVSWGLLATGPAFSSGIPVLLGAAGSIYLSNTTLPAAPQTRLRLELRQGAGGVVGAQVMAEGEGGEEDMYLFQSAGTGALAYGPTTADGRAGPWGFVKVDGNWLLALDGDCGARAVWREDVAAYQVYFGPAEGEGAEGVGIALEGYVF